MDRSAPNPYDLLGVRPGASPREIRHAYRTRVVTLHRSRVLVLVDDIEVLRKAYEALNDPARRNALDKRIGVPPPERGVRSPAAREVTRHSVRIGAEAQRSHAETLISIEREHDRQELAARRKRLRDQRLARLGQLALLLLLVALAVFAARQVRVL